MSQETRRRRGLDPIWWAPVLVLVVVAISTLSAMAFEGTLKDTVPLTVISDRAGLVMEDDAKVKLRGVQIGEVAKVDSYADSAGTNLSKRISFPAEQHRGRDQIQHRVRGQVRRPHRACRGRQSS